ncbi:phosphatase PAP2 family protein [Nocardioides yefusunii]|uniref:Phosphatase PAP2 family protein n=1 Tax=Nocardioides yefusunii TaxID=2500546 RepID=A0ABW1QYG0_9ACTN|nr:phosphatase PAP2 family protein [Nocardioides yefusunii]
MSSQSAISSTTDDVKEHQVREVLRRPDPADTPWTVRTVAMMVYAAALVAWSNAMGIPNDTVGVFLWLWVGTVAWNVQASPRTHLTFLRDWSLPVLGLVVYFFTRGLSDELGIPVHWTMPITVDEWFGGGTTPTELLQSAWCGDPCLKSSEPRWYDAVLATVYATHFVAGLTIAAVLWLRSRPEWVKWMRRYLAINFAGLVVYVLYPMAPPWLASQEGYLGDVARLTSRGWRDLGLERANMVLHGVGNPVAAMPSLHTGISALIALYAVQRLRSQWRWLLLAYPLVMGTALVYFGEHYVIDVIAGIALAGAVLWACEVWERRRVSRRVALTSGA